MKYLKTPKASRTQKLVTQSGKLIIFHSWIIRHWYTRITALPVVFVGSFNPLEPSIFTRELDHVAVVSSR